MKERLTAYLKKRFGHRVYFDVGKIMGGTLLRNFFRGILKLIVAGVFTPAMLGVLNSVYALFRMLAGLADFGLHYAMVTMVSAAIQKKDKVEEEQVLKVVFYMNAIVVLVLMVLGNIFAEKLSVWIWSSAELTPYMRILFLVLGGQLFCRYINGYLSSHESFTRLALFLSTLPLIMLGSVLVLLPFGRFNLDTAVIVYLVSPLVTALIWWRVVDMGFVKRTGWDRALLRRIFKFSGWVYMSNITSTTRNHANTLFLKNAHLSGSVAAGEFAAGQYSFGSNLANEITVISQSLTTVLLPKASRKTTPAELRSFAKKSYRNIGLLLVPLLLMMFLAGPMLTVLAWIKASFEAYRPSIPVFMILYSGTLFTIAAIPMKTVLYSLKKPQVESYMEIATLFLLVGGSLLMIPRYGFIGAAWVVFAQRAVSFLCLFGFGWYYLRKAETE